MSRADFPAGVAVVVGGSGGIGRAICARLAEAGTDVALTYRANESAAEEAAARVRTFGRTAEIYKVSAEEEAEVTAFVATAIERFGEVHTLVHAAGSDIPMRFVSEMTPAEWRGVLDADATGCFHFVRGLLPHLRQSKGSVVAVTSAGLARFPSRDLLSVAPKAAIEALLRALAKEEGRFGVRANSVALGVIEAGIFSRLQGGELGTEWVEAAKKNTPLRRFGTAEEVADAVVFLASSRAAYITGQTLTVDGGYSV